ncbi:MAG TPA: c-type cytochrome biogenesis protein CcmI [Caulobacteraceae bacterium]|jgi:cytochrome c-type biogenesis protein CcmH
MIGFWAAAAVLAAGAAALMLGRAAQGARVASRVDPQIEVYRRAIGEIDELADRDLLAPDDRRQLRAEAARRLIGASDQPAPQIHASLGRGASLAAASAVAIFAVGIYALIGSPNLPDQPFAQRLAGWQAHPEDAPPDALAATLEAIADRRPGDPTPLRKLAALDLSLGDADGAAHALRRALIIEPADADLAAMLGEVKVLQGGGTVTPEAQALFRRAYAADSHQAAARYYLAKAAISDGDVAGGLTRWRALLVDLPANDARRAALASEIAATERNGRLTEPAAAEATPPASDMTGAIRGMVDSLAARLAAHPDDPDGWVRLVRAYAVLGDDAGRDGALATARKRYAGRPDELAALADAAKAPPMGAGNR